VTLDVKDLTVVASSGHAIVDAVSFSVRQGTIMGLVGESGSGKSTLALAILGFARAGARIAGGEVRIDGANVLALRGEALRKARGRTVAYIPQDPATALNPALSVGEQLLEVLPRGARAADEIARILMAVGLPSDRRFLQRVPSELSGGQQQRIAIAMAIAPRPQVLILDEPTTGLDVSTQALVLALIAQLCTERNMAGVYISHDLAVVAQIAAEVTVLYGGMVIETGSTAAVLARPAHPYTRSLLRAVPSVAERTILRPIRGIAPGIDNRPPGCVFSDRCEFAADACREAVPPLLDTGAATAARCIRIDQVLEAPAPVVVAPARVAQADEPITLAVRGLNIHYGATPVVFDVDFDLPRGSCLAVVGESGSGKTTLSRCLIGLHSDATGRVLLDGGLLKRKSTQRTNDQRRRIQYVFQNPYASLHPRRTIRKSLRLAAEAFGITRTSEVTAAIEEALARVEIPRRLMDRYPNELSGGQRQRIAIARALLARPEVLICDEVTSALDVSVQASIVELLRKLLADGLAMVFVTHNLAVVRSIADDIIVLRSGRIVERGSAEAVLDHPQDSYTLALLQDAVDLPNAERSESALDAQERKAG
jgi:peptide/nickel transport system ATP-binding protein